MIIEDKAMLMKQSFELNQSDYQFINRLPVSSDILAEISEDVLFIS